MSNSMTPEQLFGANTANLEVLQTLARTAMAAAERLVALNLNTTRALLEDSVANAKALLGVKDLQEMADLRPTLEKAGAYSRSVYEITAQAQEEFNQAIKAQFDEVNTNIVAVLEKAASSGPAGSDVTVAAVKSAIAAANSAFDSLNSAAKQVAGFAEASMTAGVTATNKPAARGRGRKKTLE